MLTIGKKPIKFQLKKEFKENLMSRTVKWGYGGLSEFTFYRTYSRRKENGTLETWAECVIRVIEGMFSILKTHAISSHLPWDEKKAHKLAEEAADRLFVFKWTPPGRGLWMMNTDYMWERGALALYNCAFVSTEDIDAELSKPFAFVMDAMMCGVGVGYDTDGAGKIAVHKPTGEPELIVVDDNREGWVELISCLIDSYLEEGSNPIAHDTHKVRPYGTEIKGFGGVASGPEPLIQGFNGIKEILENRVGQLLTASDIVSIMGVIGKVVVAGNVRRSALLALGQPSDEEYVTLKNWDKNPIGMGIQAPLELKEENESHYNEYNSWETSWDRKSEIAREYASRVWSWKFGGWLWASNNSLYASSGLDYSPYVDSISQNGEPGFFWLDTARSYGRLKDGIKTDDIKIKGLNPCLSGDTLIAVADGRNAVSIKQLAEEEKDVPVYCINDLGQTTVQWAVKPRKTGTSKQLYKITLDDGMTIRATDNHEFYKPNGVRVALKDLKPGDSLLARKKWVAALKKNSQDYMWVSSTYHNGRNKSEHRLFSEFMLGRILDSEEVVHHRNYKGLDNSHTNLEVMTKEDHDILHSKDMVGQKNPYFRMSEEWKANFGRPRYGAENGMYGKQHSEETKQLISEKAKARWEIPEYRERMTAIIKNSMSNLATREKIAASQKARFESCEKVVIEEEEVNSILSTPYHWTQSNKLYFVRKIDPIDGKEFLVPLSERHIQTHCKENGLKLRAISAQRTAHAKAAQKLNLIVDEVKKYIATNSKIPTSREIISLVKANLGIDYRVKTSQHRINKPSDILAVLADELSMSKDLFNPYKLKGGNSYNTDLAKKVLSNEAFCYNHKVVSIEPDSVEDVYCMTVPSYANFMIINEDVVTTSAGKKKFSMIPSANCAEIQLESYETCNLNENYPANHEDYWDFQRTLKFSYLYSKAVTLLATNWPDTNATINKNRRIGCSVSGVQEAFIKFGRKDFLTWLDQAYEYLTYLDKKYSDWLGIPRSIRRTTVKPSGTVSLLAGALPGIHHTESASYYRTVRLAANSPMVDILKRSNYRIEPAASDPTRTLVVYFPVLVDSALPDKANVSIWQQFKDVADMQKLWADNAVSVTVTFTKDEVNQIAPCLSAFDSELKSVSLLPYSSHGYVQAPYIAMPREEIEQYAATLLPLDFTPLTLEGENAESNKFCSNDSCAI
jgi:ribonucleotide reductase alpha subunit